MNWFEKKIIKRERQGAPVYYSSAVSETVMDYIITILAYGGPKKLLSLARKMRKEMRKSLKPLFSAAKRAKKVENEILELEASGEETYGLKGIRNARQRKIAKSLVKEVGLKPSGEILGSYRKKLRRELTHPRKVEPSKVVLPSGLEVNIRKMKLLEAIDIINEAAPSDEIPADLKEAIKRLLS
jgi:hypothetical protein